ncbi:hypothetical protein [Ornithinimicrobium kibberense]|uniref:hypothetical protein n=1 Tax=Ornithinimicrobium kibberense TaxID=282060 RepID=UPI0036189602
MVAMPSRRLSSSVRRAADISPSALTRARSSRMRSATTWNFVRTEGGVRPRLTAASTSRTTLASTWIVPSASWPGPRRVRVRASCWRVRAPF